MIKTVKPKLIFCSEARVTNEICDEVKIDGFNEIICMSTSRFTGGVVIYVSNELKFKILYNNSIDDTFWCLVIEIIDSHLMGIYSCFYRANKANSFVFDEQFEEFLSNAVNLNINLNEKSKKVNDFNRAYKMHGLSYISDFFTRITQESQTKIDVILTNATDRVHCFTNPKEKITDHETIQIEIDSEKRNFNEKKMVISWREYNKERLLINLMRENWNFESMQLDEMVDLLRSNVENSVKPLLKNVVIRSNTNNKSWFDEQLMVMKKERDDKYYKWSNERIGVKWCEYVEARNSFNKMVKFKKEQSIKNNLRKNSTNQKAKWRYLSKLLPNKKNLESQVQ